MRRVLVAFDGSETSERALERALKISGKNAKVHVLYVIDEDEIRWPSRIDISLIWDGNIRELEENILEIHKKHAERVLENAKAVARRLRRKVDVMYDVGSVPEKIVENAEKLGAELIILGSRSKSQIEFLLGSVAEKVVAKSKIPVLIVKSEDGRKKELIPKLKGLPKIKKPKMKKTKKGNSKKKR